MELVTVRELFKNRETIFGSEDHGRRLDPQHP